MTRKLLWIAAAGLAGGLAAAGLAVAQPGSRPVRIGLDGSDFDACAGYAEVRGLDPRGDNFLAVRAAPFARARELDRLGPGRRVWVCEEDAERGWSGIVYGARGSLDCNVGSPVPRPRAYAGRCRQGWVSSRYLTVIAG